MNEDKSDNGSDWIERLTRVAGWLGFNPVRVRWKLARAQLAWRRSQARWRQKILHLRYEHSTCPYCGGVNDRSERVCTSCGRPLLSRAVQILDRVGLAIPDLLSVSSLLGFFMALIYARMVLAQGGGGLWSFSIETLYRFGAHYPPDGGSGTVPRSAGRFATACSSGASTR